MSQYRIKFYGVSKDGKRTRVGQGNVDATGPEAALKSAYDLLSKSDKRASVNEVRVEAQGAESFHWTEPRKATTTGKAK